MTKIVATSDLHGTLPEIPECDILLIAGDVCPDYIRSSRMPDRSMAARYHKGQPEQANWLGDIFKPWLEEVPAKFIVGIAGNHDFVFENKFLVPDLPWIYLEDQGATVAGIRIYGIPWVPNLPFWAFHADDIRLEAAYGAVQECDILLSHGPPHGYLDVVPSKYGSASGTNVGAFPANAALLRTKPSYMICGHIHEGYGEVNHVGGTRIINVAHNDGFYNPVNQPIIIDEF